jgi:hypothetical protein
MKPRKHLNMAAVQHALEENDSGVDQMKREVMVFQETELVAAQRELVTLRKMHDKLFQDADAADLLHGKVCEELSELERMAGVGGKSRANNAVITAGDLNTKIAETEAELKASTEQGQVFGHMIERLKREILVLQKEDNVKRIRVAQMAHEMASNTVQHQQAVVELAAEEKKLETLMSKLAVKREQHESRLTGIKKIIEERSLLLERQDERNKKKEEIMTKADLGIDEEQKLKRMNVIRQLYTTILEKKMTDDEDHLNSLENTFHRLKNVTGLTNVNEVVEKFMSRNEKNKQLAAVAEDLNRKIDAVKAENYQSRISLDELISRTEANAGNREVYQEVDLIDVAVGSATKQCDDSKNRSTRLSVTIGELRETIARFLSKVQNTLVSVPAVKQLPDKIHELDIHLTEMMKTVSANLAKKENDDASSPVPAGDTSEGKGPSGDGTFAKLAGANLGKIMYHKMMTTEPDQTPRNVRVATKMNAMQLGKHEQRRLLDPNFETSNPPPSAAHMVHSSALNNTEGDEDQPHKGVVDRDTVKKLSKLVVSKVAAEKKRLAMEQRKLMEKLEAED